MQALHKSAQAHLYGTKIPQDSLDRGVQPFGATDPNIILEKEVEEHQRTSRRMPLKVRISRILSIVASVPVLEFYPSLPLCQINFALVLDLCK